jgi:hypothetical protein
MWEREDKRERHLENMTRHNGGHDDGEHNNVKNEGPKGGFYLHLPVCTTIIIIAPK